ncbi:nucleoside-diphosphate sugar epimerase [Longibacter salinarum]|uniref:Nucleoside-diphosphate sugar epimerase n=1 Tax=Longibacter salinarum TaxID=1850348 RepID=A0A2A8D144_9BACT|nr:NAD-dependent epimerase/dehydratase family protein [Longibacter salinarum]PEN14527.1 nucleoside-diphosphate sugar epimerase [Longibacter salinarum]
MHYLITGGAGFIGSHLADALLDADHSVLAYDNLSTGRRGNIAHLEQNPRFSLAVGDVLDRSRLDEAISKADVVIHLAAAVGVKRVMEKPVETIKTNVGGTETVLELAHQHDKKIAIASTSEVYGKAMQKDEELDALSETDDWTLGTTSKRRWAYACSKAMDEFLAKAYADEHGLDVISLRFFNTVGPRQSGRYGMVIPNFVRQALAGEDIRVFGDGKQTRCFTHVFDAVEAVQRLLASDDDLRGEVFNVGSRHEISIRNLAERVRTLTDSDSNIVYVPYEEVYGAGFEDMRRRTPDVTKLRETIDFIPGRPTDEILQDVIAAVREA